MSTSKALILGTGVIGLRTALSLTRRGVKVSLRSSSAPLLNLPENCSQGAGGLWMPFHCDDERTDRWAAHQLKEYHDDVNGDINKNCSSSSVIELVPTLSFKQDAAPVTSSTDTNSYLNDHDAPSWALSPGSEVLNFQSFSPSQLKWQSEVTKVHVPDFAGEYDKAWQWTSPVVDCPRSLKAMAAEILAAGGTIDHTSSFSSVADARVAAKADDCTSIVNCLGVNGGTLVGDTTVTPARGVLKYYTRRPDFTTCILVDEGPRGSDTNPIYAIPRGDVVAIGGTYLENDGEGGVRPEEEETLRENARVLLPDGGEGFTEIGNWVGFRPVREGGVRLGRNEELDGDGVGWIDNYGHGGSGWTVASGCAEDVAELLLA